MKILKDKKKNEKSRVEKTVENLDEQPTLASLPDERLSVQNEDEEKDVNVPMTKPATSFELERDWRSFESNSKLKAKYLKFINDPDLIAAFFAPQLPKYVIQIARNNFNFQVSLNYSSRYHSNFELKI